ncbi:hypothetical protein CTA2_2912 [Colletotrichum tanaceti]|uniref:Pentatricopeptide repeat-containing protein, mitochondrial n=1 Tax=Colletotrichum tanaceti TaxID=1306861 RepID=A0A4U6XF17_9PEZI|nr:hypothetical protein CTA2_2912 [Colletotrichum tanaceti]TKW53909.1 hypothetical protein CTA1_8155 [Colletotrichum tanaceti]
MQAIWSRAGQAHHCGCKAGFNAAGGMMRQSATRVTRRKPTFSEVFTACYTSIMGTAAVLDAQKKDERRKELDRQLEEARAEFRMLVENAPPPHPRERVPDACPAPYQLHIEQAPYGSIVNRFKGTLRRYKKQPEEIFEFFDSLGYAYTWEQVASKSEQVKDLWHQYQLEPQEQSCTAGDTDYELLASFIASEEKMFWIQHRMPKTTQHLETVESAMRRLVRRLLDYADEVRFEQYGASPEKCDSEAFERVVDDLRKSGHPHYDVFVDRNAVSRCSADLNSSLRDVFGEAKPSNILPTLMKVCHNILVASQPPTIHTYNTLLHGFSSVGLHEPAWYVVKALLHSRTEPTQSTLVCLLNHFKERHDRFRFNQIIERMTGKDRRGILIRRKFVDQVRETPWLHRWAMTKDVVVNRCYVIERAWFDVRVLTAIIEGMLRLGYLRYAADTMALGFKLGFVFSMQAIMAVVNTCVLALDPKPAMVILKAFASRPSLIEAKFSEEPHRAYIARRVQSLLYICRMSEISPATVVPSVEAVPVSELLSESQKRGLTLAVVTRLVDQAEIKTEFFRSSLAAIEECLADCQSGEGTEGLEASKEVQETVTISSNNETTDSWDKTDAQAFEDRFKAVRSKPDYEDTKAVASF